MRNDLTELVYILDMSGSMAPLASDTIGGYNTLLAEQKKAKGDAFVTTVLFDDRYILLHNRTDIKDVEPITEKEYCPYGMTAMLDAIGKTLVSVGKTLADMDEKDRPGQVIVTIITDGEENASKEYTWARVQSMIKEQREKYSWLFTFIGANIDVEHVSDSLGIDRKLAKKYQATKAGVDSVYRTMSAINTHARASAACGASRESIIDDAAQLMDEIK